MARENTLTSISLEAGSDMSSNQYRFVTLASDGQFDLTSDGADATGVLQDAPAAAGRAGQVAISGVTKLRLGGTVAVGDDVSSGANGLGNVAATGDVILAEAHEAGDSGDIVTVLLKPGGKSPLT